MQTPTTGEQLDPDSVARFVTDLDRLRLVHAGHLTFTQLERATGLSRSSLHKAVRDTTKLPSAATTSRLVGFLAPQDVPGWLDRRHQISPEKHAQSVQAPIDGPSQAALTAPREAKRSNSPSRRLAWLGAIAGSAIATGLLTVPFERGGIDVASYCTSNHPRTDRRSGEFNDGTWTGWKCLLTDGTTVSVDLQLACRQQYPASGPFGGAQFAVHNNRSFASWRCWGSLLHGWA